MWWPKPKVPKGFFGWKLKNRQRFCNFYWNPMWKAKNFCEKWLTIRGLKLAYEGLVFRISLWWYIRQYNKKKKKGGQNG